MWTEAIPSQYGESRVVSHGTGYEAVLNFKPYSFLSGNVADVEGKVLNKAGEPVLYIRPGGCGEASCSGSPPQGAPVRGPDPDRPAPAFGGRSRRSLFFFFFFPQTIWTKTQPPAWSEQQYNFTDFAITLNEMEPGQAEAACPTDCRFRPDQVRTHPWRAPGTCARAKRAPANTRGGEGGRQACTWGYVGDAVAAPL